MSDQDWAEVLKVPEIEVAYHAVRVLEAAGISAEVWPSPPPRWRETTVQGHDLWGDHSVGPHRVMVAPGDSARARDVLRARTIPRPT